MGDTNRRSADFIRAHAPIFIAFAAVVMGFSAVIIAAVVFWPRPAIEQPAVWKPTGDGRTVVNTTTGEIRVTATGEEVTAFNDRIQRDEEAKQDAAYTAESQAEIDRIWTEYRAENRRLDAEEKRVKEAIQRQGESFRENGRNYHIAQLIVLPFNEIAVADWWQATEPFRSDEFPTERQRDALLRLASDGVHPDELKSDDCQQLCNALRAMTFHEGTSGMLRTTSEEQASALAVKALHERMERRFGRKSR